jgi:outer membrane protein, heavy metal efflux system
MKGCRIPSARPNYLLAVRSLELSHSEDQIRQEQVEILTKRFSAGEIPRPEIDLAQIELSKTHLAIRNGEGQVAEARAALGASIGISAAGLDGFDFAWTDLDAPPSAESFSPDEIRRDATLNRLDIRRTLAQYAAAEAGLKLEIAKQYPDLSIGPGYTYEEGKNFFTVGLSATLPLGMTNTFFTVPQNRLADVAVAYAKNDMSLVRPTAPDCV